MCGRSAASSLNSCLDNQSSPERAEWTNSSRSSKSWEHRPANRSKQWTQNTRSTVSLKSDPCPGRRYSDTERLAKQLTSLQDFFSTTLRPGQLLCQLSWTLTSMNSGTRTADCQMEEPCPTYSTSLKTSIIWNQRLFSNVSRPGTLDLNTARRHERNPDSRQSPDPFDPCSPTERQKHTDTTLFCKVLT